MILIKKREQRDLTRKVICDCGCGESFHPFKHRKAAHNFVNSYHYWKYRRTHHVIGHSKLTDKQVIEINKLKGTASTSEVAEEYGVRPIAIEQIWNGLRWNHITHNK